MCVKMAHYWLKLKNYTLAFFKAYFLNKTKMEKSKVKQSKIQTETKKTLTPMREMNESKTMKCS